MARPGCFNRAGEDKPGAGNRDGGGPCRLRDKEVCVPRYTDVKNNKDQG